MDSARQSILLSALQQAWAGIKTRERKVLFKKKALCHTAEQQKTLLADTNTATSPEYLRYKTTCTLTYP